MELPFQRTSALVRQACTRAVVVNLDRASQSPREFKAQIPGPHPRITDSVGWRWGEQRICISKKFLGDAAAAGQWATLWELLLQDTGKEDYRKIRMSFQNPCSWDSVHRGGDIMP